MNHFNTAVSIIIVNYNTSKLINNCIESIVEKTVGIDYEIIIVDNNTENLSSVISSRNNCKIRFLQLKENIGFGRANNEGFKIATGRNIFYLNPDTILVNNAVKLLSDFIDSHPDCGACGGNLFDENMMPTLSFKRVFPGFFEETDQACKRFLSKLIFGKNYSYNTTDNKLKVAYITGADLMVRREIIDSVGGFDKDIFLYYEETELQYRISKSGYTIWSIPNAKIIHLEGKSINIPRQREKESLISRQKYYKKTSSKTYWFAIDLYYWLITTITYLFTIPFGSKELKSKLKQRKELLDEIG